MESRRFGVSRASRQMQVRTARREQKLEAQAEADEMREFDSYFDYEESEPLKSPFAVRSNPTQEELQEMREMSWFYDPDTYNY
jgi:hypothetical protein